MSIGSFLQRIITSVLPYVLFLSGVGGFAFAYIVIGPDYGYKSLIYVIPVILAALILISRSKTDSRFILIYINRLSFTHLVLITILLYIVSIIILISSPTRSWAYFIVIAIISGLIFTQTLCKRSVSTDYLIIFEIILLSLNLIWGVSIKYPLYFGDTDVFLHLHYIETVVQTGHITSIGLDYKYFPLFHIFNAMGVDITGLSLKSSMFIFSGVLWQAGILFAYLVFKKLSNSSTF